MNTEKQNEVQKKPVGLWTLACQWAGLYYRALISIRISDLVDIVKDYATNGRSLMKGQYEEFMQKVSNLPATNYQLGMYHLNHGAFRDAILRFKIALFFNHTIYPAHFYLGRCYYQQLKFDKAQHHFELYKASGDQRFIQATEFCLTIMQSKQDEDLEIPQDIVAMNFNQIAQKYDENFIMGKVNIPQDSLFSALNEHLQNIGKPFGNLIVDLGCGTGYIGSMIRQSRLSGMLVGVDISREMALITQKRMFEKAVVYNQVFNSSMQDFIAHYRDNEQTKFNVVIAANLLTYIKDISSFFLNVKSIMLEGGTLVVSFKTTQDANNDAEFDRYLEAYYFSATYIKELAVSHGFKLVKEKDIKFLQEEQGKLMIFTL